MVSKIIKALKRVPNQNANVDCVDESGAMYEVHKIIVKDGKPIISVRRKGEK